MRGSFRSSPRVLAIGFSCRDIAVGFSTLCCSVFRPSAGSARSSLAQGFQQLVWIEGFEIVVGSGVEVILGSDILWLWGPRNYSRLREPGG